MSLVTYIDQFLEYLEITRNSSKLTIRNYRHYLKRFSEFAEKHFNKTVTDLSLIDMNLIRDYRLHLSRITDEKEMTLKRITQNYHLIALRAFLRYLVRNDVKVLSPEKIELGKAESRSIKFLSRDQVERLLNMPKISEIAGLRDKAILEVLFSTGLRVSELVRLNRTDIDFERKEFGVRGKGGKVRVVFLSDSASRWLSRYLKERDDGLEALFIRYAGKKTDAFQKEVTLRLTMRSVQRIVEKYAKRAKLTIKITPHGLRHSFATDLLSNGADLRAIQELLGHKNVSTTQIYTHITNPQLKEIHNRFHRR